MPESDWFLRYRISAGMQNFTLGKSDVYVLAAAATCGFTMVSFTELVSHQNTFVGGTCAPPSALLVFCYIHTPYRFTHQFVYKCCQCSTHDVYTSILFIVTNATSNFHGSAQGNLWEFVEQVFRA